MNKLIALFLLLPTIACAQLDLKDQLPPWATERWEAAANELQLQASGRINPFYQRGDFDGDGKPDVAVFVQHKNTRKGGILILLRSGKRVLLGAGRTFANGGDNFNWIDLWWIEDRGTVQQSGYESAVTLHGDGLLVAKEGSGSSLIYFKEGKFRWQQQGD